MKERIFGAGKSKSDTAKFWVLKEEKRGSVGTVFLLISLFSLTARFSASSDGPTMMNNECLFFSP